MRRPLLLASALLLLGAAAPSAAPAPTPAPTAEPAKNRVAVLYFEYTGKNEDLFVLRKGLAQMLATDLANSGQISVVERMRLQEILDELKLTQSRKFDPSTTARLGKLLGVHYLVMGHFYETKGTFVVQAQTTDAETGEHKGDVYVAGKSDDFLELEQKIATRLIEKISKLVPPATSTPAQTGSSATPPDPSASPKASPQKLAVQTVVKYSKALDALDRKDREAAKKELESVVKEQPDFKLAASELAALML
ncbi:MAG TPA: CsgG/HfaB family protein [Myxococcales bacterium]